jgi:hypothetical protein
LRRDFFLVDLLFRAPPLRFGRTTGLAAGTTGVTGLGRAGTTGVTGLGRAGTTGVTGLGRTGTTGAIGLGRAGTTGVVSLGRAGLGREAKVPIAAVPEGIALFSNAAVASPVCNLAKVGAAGAAPVSPTNAFRGDLPMGGRDENNCPILLREEFLC